MACIGTLLNWFGPSLIWRYVLLNTTFDTSLGDHDRPWIKVTRVWDSKTFCTNYVTKFTIKLDAIWCTGFINIILILSCLISIARRGPYLGALGNRLWHWLVFTELSVKLGVMIITTKLFILILVWMTFICGQCCSRVRNQNFCVHFLANFSVNLDEIECVATTCWFVEANAEFMWHDQH